MRLICILFLILSVLLCSCQRERQNQAINPDNIEHVLLNADSLNLKEKLLAPRKVFVLGSDIVIFEPKDKEGFLHFYGADGMQISKYGMVGNASNEYLYPNVFANGESLIIVSMDGKYREIKKGFSGRKVGSAGSIENKAIAMGANFLALTANGGIVVESASSDDMLVFVTPDGEEFKYNDYPVKISEKMNAFLKKDVISSCSYSISTELDTLFQAFKYYPSVSVISTEDKRSCRTVLSLDKHNEYKLKDGVPYYADPVLFYTYAASSGKYFYALFQNDTKSGIREGGSSEIHVFSQSGSLQKRYLLDRRIYHFAVTPDDSAIYALGLNGEFLSELYVYCI